MPFIKINKMQKFFVFFITLVVISCQSKEEEIFSKNYDLEFITENVKPEDYKKHLLKDSITLQKDTDFVFPQAITHKMKTESGKEFEWKQHNFSSEYFHSNYDNQFVAKLYKMHLGSINFITYGNQLVGVIAFATTANGDDDVQTIDYLTKKYGKPVDLVESKTGRKSIVEQELQLYWQSQDKIIGIALLDNGNYSEEDKGVIPITTYQVYVINQKMKHQLKKENIELTDFFENATTADNYYLGNVLRDLKSKN